MRLPYGQQQLPERIVPMWVVGLVLRPLWRVYPLDRLLRRVQQHRLMQAQLLRQLPTQVLQPQDLLRRLRDARRDPDQVSDLEMSERVHRRRQQLLMTDAGAILTIAAGVLSGYAAAWSP